MIKTSDDVKELKVVLDKALKPLTKEIASDILSRAQENLVNSGHVDRGILLRSGYMRDLGDGVEIGFSAIHASVINWGRHPSESPPPFEEIYEWVQRHKSKFGVKKKEDITKLTWAIVKSIQKNGWKGCFFFTNAVNGVMSQYKIK